MRPPVTEAEAYRLLERLRWGGAPDACPHCAAVGRSYFLRPVGGRPRRTRTGRPSPRRVWKCGACRRQFSVLTGTIFEGTRIGLRTWLAVVASAVDGVPSASAVAAAHRLSPEGARHLVRRLTAARAVVGGDGPSLAALLRIPADEAAAIRDRTPGRPRPRRQAGPTASYG